MAQDLRIEAVQFLQKSTADDDFELRQLVTDPPRCVRGVLYHDGVMAGDQVSIIGWSVKILEVSGPAVGRRGIGTLVLGQLVAPRKDS